MGNTITCLECQKTGIKAISPHLKAHPGLTLQGYKDKFRVNGKDPEIGWTVQSQKRPGTPIVLPLNTAQKVIANNFKKDKKNELTEEEQSSFDARYKVLFLQAEEDPALDPSIKEIVSNEVTISRFQAMISTYTNQIETNPGVLDTIATLGKLVKEMQSSNLATMKSLSLTREAKKASKQSVQTTPSRLVSGLENFLRTSHMETVRRLNQDMEESAARIRRNFEQLSKEQAVETGRDDGEPEEDLVPESL